MNSNGKNRKQKISKRVRSRLRGVEIDEDEHLTTIDLSNIKIASYHNYNSQIVLNPNVNILKYLKIIDPSVEFNDIFCFIKPYNEEITCPVCLEDPKIPVMTKCGHLFCWPCILQCILVNESNINLNSLSINKLMSKCPCCMSSIKINDIKLVIWRHIKVPVLESEIQMNLCVRNPTQSHITLAQERNSKLITCFNDMTEESPGKWFVNNRSFHRNIMLNHVLDFPYDSNLIINKYFDSLISYLKTQQSLENFNTMNSITFHIVKSIGNLRSLVQEAKPSNFVLNINKKLFKSFYQMVHGYNVYLHPKNYNQITQHLVKIGKDINDGPMMIKGKVLGISHYVANSKLLEKYKFLNHLPLNNHFSLVYLDITNPEIQIDEIPTNVNTDPEGNADSTDTSDDNTCYYYKRNDNESKFSSADDCFENFTFYMLNSLDHSFN